MDWGELSVTSLSFELGMVENEGRRFTLVFLPPKLMAALSSDSDFIMLDIRVSISPSVFFYRTLMNLLLFALLDDTFSLFFVLSSNTRFRAWECLCSRTGLNKCFEDCVFFKLRLWMTRSLALGRVFTMSVTWPFSLLFTVYGYR